VWLCARALMYMCLTLDPDTLPSWTVCMVSGMQLQAVGSTCALSQVYNYYIMAPHRMAE
jgi:hypothetical protein